MGKKLIILIILVIIGILIILFLINIYYKNKCGDGICQKFEERRESCIVDCEKIIIKNNESNDQNLQPSACKVISVEKIAAGSFPRISKTGMITFTREVNSRFEVFKMNADGTN